MKIPTKNIKLSESIYEELDSRREAYAKKKGRNVTFSEYVQLLIENCTDLP